MRPILTPQEYLNRVLARITTLQPCIAGLDEAYGCVLAEEITASRDLPPFTSSAMDGFAVRSSDIAGASQEHPVALEIAGEVSMGRIATGEVAKGAAIAVPTGGMVPAGPDTVLPAERCLVRGRQLVVAAPSPPGSNVRPAGEDLRRGQVLVEEGRYLQPVDLGALAATGRAEVRVIPRPRVAILSTGDELVEPGSEPGPGQIWESNSYLLKGLVRSSGADPVNAGRVADDPAALLDALNQLIDGIDAVVCSGGVSAGRNDPVRRAFAGRCEVECVSVSIKPGRPQAFGMLSGKPFFGLPGNPMAALVGFELFVRPALRKMAGQVPDCPRIAASFEGAEQAPPESVRYLPVLLTYDGAEIVACAAGPTRSNQLATLARAGGLVELPAGTKLISGDRCTIIPLRHG